MTDDSDFEIETPPPYPIKKRAPPKDEDIVFPPPPPPPGSPKPPPMKPLDFDPFDPDTDDEDIPFAELQHRKSDVKALKRVLQRRKQRAATEAKRRKKEESFRAASEFGKKAVMKLFTWFSQESRAGLIAHITTEDLLKFVFNMLAAQSPSIEDYLKKIDDFITLADQVRNDTEATYEMTVDADDGKVKVNEMEGLNSVYTRLEDAKDLAKGRKKMLEKYPVYADYYKDPDYVPSGEDDDDTDDFDE